MRNSEENPEPKKRTRSHENQARGFFKGIAVLKCLITEDEIVQHMAHSWGALRQPARCLRTTASGSRKGTSAGICRRFAVHPGLLAQRRQ
jgi:hypothetical protein